MSLFSVVLGLPCCAGVSLAEASRAAPPVARASRGRGCSRGAGLRAHARLSWPHVASVITAPGLHPVPHRLVALGHVGSSQLSDRARVPCLGRWILRRRATREALSDLFLREMNFIMFRPLWSLFAVAA